MTTLKRGQLLGRKINSLAPTHTSYLWKHRVRTQCFLLCCPAITYPIHTAYPQARCHQYPIYQLTHLFASFLQHHTPTSFTQYLHSASSPTELPGSSEMLLWNHSGNHQPIKNPFVPQSSPCLQFPSQGFTAELQTQDTGLTTLDAKGRIWPLQWPVNNVLWGR